MLQDQARPARAEAERKQEQVVAGAKSALVGHVAQVDDVITADGMPDLGDVLRPDSAHRNPEELGEDPPTPQADVAGNDPANIGETEARLFDRAADGALGHRKIGGDELALLLR